MGALAQALRAREGGGSGGGGRGGAAPLRLRRVGAGEISPAEFARSCLAPNDAVVVVEGAVREPEGPGRERGAGGGVTEWAAAGLWRDPASGGVDIEALARAFGDSSVCATECPAPGEPEPEHGRCSRTLPFSEYAQYWRRLAEARRGGACVAEPLLYVQNWHLPSELPPREGAPFYAVPELFRRSGDWLNAFLDAERRRELGRGEDGGGAGASDYRFVYLGPAGTSTPLHVDVLHSYSWSVNVAGRKRWRLVPPEWTECLLGPGGELAPSLDPALPGFPRVREALAHVVEVVQETGEALFVPSGWHHTVENLEDTLSINHNWINAYNCGRSWGVLRADFREACRQIEDCRSLCPPGEFLALALRNLRLNSGLQLPMFGRMLAQAAAAAQDTEPGDEYGRAQAALDLRVSRGLLREVLVELTAGSPEGARESPEVRDLETRLRELEARP